MTKQELAKFPALTKAFDAFPDLPALDQTYMASLFPDHEFFHSFPSMETAMSTLFRRRTPSDLSSQIRGVFDRNAEKWNAAMTELLAFSLLEQAQVLADIGWPHGPGGDTPPFDGTLVDVHGAKGNTIPFEVKNAANVGLYLLDREFRSVVDVWCKSNKLPEAEIEYRTIGPVTREALGPAKRDMVESLRAQLARTRTFPSSTIILRSTAPKIRKPPSLWKYVQRQVHA
jgi:hypothetical protein